MLILEFKNSLKKHHSVFPKNPCVYFGTLCIYLELWYNKHFLQCIQSAKIFLLPPKYQMIMVPSNHSFFQYCDSNIWLFSFAPCKVITLDPLSILFGISSLLLFWCLSFQSYRSFNYRDSDSCRSVLLLNSWEFLWEVDIV